MSEPIIIVEYNPRWPEMYAEERARIALAVGPVFIAYEHVGSTAVPGLGAKPIIDIMAAVQKLDDAEMCVGLLGGIGYDYVPEFNALIPDRRFFRKGSPRSHHLHVTTTDADFWKKHLLFRNYLRAHPATAREYYELKLKLAAQYGVDRDGYTNAKTEFVRGVEQKAQVEAGAQR
jgi:GrpB-like predicted nucleotidyltransferase (UPF0157 family)